MHHLINECHIQIVINNCLLAVVPSRRVRGKTVGKGVEKLIAQNGREKLDVPVLEQFNALCGINAPKAANLLGVEIRRLSPIIDTPTWWHIDEATRSCIIQAVLVCKFTSSKSKSSLRRLLVLYLAMNNVMPCYTNNAIPCYACRISSG